MGTARFDGLDVYRRAMEYVGITRPLVIRLRTEDPVVGDQLHRAVISIPCNLAEGSGEFSPGDKARFYRYALRSTTESIALLDVSQQIGVLSVDDHRVTRELGMRVVAMLTKLVLVTTGRDRERLRKRLRRRDDDE